MTDSNIGVSVVVSIVDGTGRVSTTIVSDRKAEDLDDETLMMIVAELVKATKTLSSYIGKPDKKSIGPESDYRIYYK